MDPGGAWTTGEAFCPVAETARLIGDEYVLLILRDLADGPRRFTSLGQSVEVNAKTLTERLRRMEQQGLVQRTMYPEIPPRVEYALTGKGAALLPVLEAMRAYGERWLAPRAREAVREP
jgi:DNA-binding HxlR family transcriptional regulator